MVASVDIISTGARTSVGCSSAPAAAAVRANLNAFVEHPFMVDQVGDPMTGAMDALLDSGVMGPERMVAMAESALREACAPLDGNKGALSFQLPVFLGLPEIRPGFTKQDAQAVGFGLSGFKGLPIEISEVNIFTEGHAAGLSAMATAMGQIRQGVFDACLVGGVDSYFQPDTMEWLDENRQLVGAVSRSAFVPGEGAGFCLMMNERARNRLGLGAMARVRSIATGRETKLIKTEEVCLGEGLTKTVQAAVGGLPGTAQTINDIICDINGERYRGEEWGFVSLRLPQYFRDPTAYRSPADCWGDIGAASGPLFVMLACQAAERGYAAGPRSLLWASSEGGLRAAAVLGFEPFGKNDKARRYSWPV